MTDSERHESQDLEDYTVDSASDTLSGDPGEEPVDRGVAPPSHWTAGMRYALEGEEDSESMDELLSEQEPDVLDELDEEPWDENATGEEVRRLERDEGSEPRAGRLVAPVEDTDDISDTLDSQGAEVARDVGIDGGAASAEEAAVHVIGEADDAGDSAE
ncbi:MAG TPA: DUF5709 domain-containing protein [Trebonia sp.]